MKIVTILGARPQFIKASVVTAAIAAVKNMTEVVVHTGQHFDANMSDVFFDELGMPPPQYQLDIHGGGHGEMTGRMLMGIEKVLLGEQPDVVLVYGDTNSTLAGALAAAKLKIPVAHVEAGLRSFNMEMPEEINRILTDRISHWLFTPTEMAARHLRREGFQEERIISVGDVMFDVALHHGARARSAGGLLANLGLKPASYVLATIHRAENTDHPQRLNIIVDALERTSNFMPVVWPLHPRTRAILQRSGRLKDSPRDLHLIDPVSYLGMVQLEKYASVIATDSGGVQKEAFFYQVPCVTLRDETEWVELIDAGWNRLASPKDAMSLAAVIQEAAGSKGSEVSPYGTGKAAHAIVARLESTVLA
ncbi:non-hydrolyzing UDP-N-acetylglucosamine 2-epimerase [Variovorax sp. Varisp36]|uniref:non-hydrolyzing UDP-N-acetylglucosamine 2-epimerase n=1 Tax=Variovorax sp. Varisp36 TaxID=3243031 RepID=UPI0039A77D23